MIFTAIISFILLLLTYHFYQHYGRNGRLINQIPGPLVLPIIGNAYGVYASREFLWLIGRIYAKKFPSICKLWLFSKPFVILSNPDYMEIVLSSKEHNKKGLMYKIIDAWLGTGLLTSEGAKWHSRRKILTPAFHFNILRQFVDVLIKQGECLTKSLKSNKEAVVTDLTPLISEYTLNVICETAMGISLEHHGSSQKRYRQAVHEIIDTLFYRAIRPWLYNDWVFSLTSMGKTQAESLKILHGFTEKVIRERKQYHNDTNGQYLKNFENNTELETNSEEKTGVSRKRLALLDLLIAASEENQMSDADIREEVDTFMFEGHDTVAVGICFALLLLAEHKDIQDNIRSEVNSVMQETQGKLTYTSLQNLPYLERCLKESMRLYPSVPLIGRITSEEIKLGPYVIPVGTDINLSIYDLHRNPDFWPNPLVFDPDRFLAENIQNRHPYCYLPFSAGQRNCIGQRFALLEMKAIIASLVHNFHLEPVEHFKKVKIMVDIVYRAAHPLRMKFVPIGSK